MGAGAAVWLALWIAHVAIAPELDAGVLLSRFAHDVVLVVAAALCLWAWLASGRPARAPRLAADRARRRRRGRSASSGTRPSSGRRTRSRSRRPPTSATCCSRRSCSPASLTAAAHAASRDVPRHALGRRGHRGAGGLRRRARRSSSTPCSTTRRRQALEVALGLAYPITRPRPDRRHRRRARPAPAGSSTAPGCCCSRACSRSGSPTRSTSSATRTAPTRPARWFDAGWWVRAAADRRGGLAGARSRSPSARTSGCARIVLPLIFGAVRPGPARLRLRRRPQSGRRRARGGVDARRDGAHDADVPDNAGCSSRRDEAKTDALTGLGNRRALARALERELPRSTAADPVMLRSSISTASSLQRHVRPPGRGRAAGAARREPLGAPGRARRRLRMGGDEFCALWAGRPDARAARGRRLTALSEHGEGF